MENQSTDKLELAAKFVNNTGAPIFLTGKAGTGKTTFLKNLARQTHKKHVIVAPTGIAALNAGGVTIHSQFLFPLGFFLPVNEPEGNFSDQYGCFTQHTLIRKHPLNALRKNVLKSIELLVIDEVSMLRADVLDAIDYRLRSVKRNFNTPFGGVQVLMIGDLFQLPPIVRDNEWQILSRFYPSMHFFEARVLQESGLVYLVLDKIFRQQDEEFIQVLNHLRENTVTSEDIALLNRHFKTQEEISEIKDCITITTHNYKADQINREQLMALKGESSFYEAEIENDFPENIYPLPKSLELRVGAQVMFIKNDSSGNQDYFNGKLATVDELKADQISVLLEGSKYPYQLKKEIWENKKYIINADTKELEEEVIGTFSQFPIKTAWAVTVHKSQGLTFDQAIIDVENAFAPGQVYVALSRLRSLGGLILRTRIQNHGMQSDMQVQTFVESAQKNSKLDELLGV
ncbi:MAG: AAA family ATPase, partial [Algoriphagus sp.]